MEYFMPQASSFAANIDNVILLVAVLGGFWLLVAELIFFYFIFKYRRSKNPKASYVTGEEPQYQKWIHWPHNLIVVCDIVIIVFAVRTWYVVKQDLPAPDDTIGIVAQQWGWQFIHSGPDKLLGTADDVIVIDELHVKENATYHFKLQSKDVLHSFSVPVFRLKQDAVPGREITGWFKPIKQGTFDIQCAEMCGIGHGIMNAYLHVHSAADYDTWLQGQVVAANHEPKSADIAPTALTETKTVAH